MIERFEIFESKGPVRLPSPYQEIWDEVCKIVPWIAPDDIDLNYWKPDKFEGFEFVSAGSEKVKTTKGKEEVAQIKICLIPVSGGFWIEDSTHNSLHQDELTDPVEIAMILDPKRTAEWIRKNPKHYGSIRNRSKKLGI